MQGGYHQEETRLVVSAFQKEEAAEVLRRTAAERNAKLIMVDPGKISDVRYGVEEQSFPTGRKKISVSIWQEPIRLKMQPSPRRLFRAYEALALQFPAMPSEEE